MINLYRSKNILISRISILDSPSSNVHPVLCENINIDGVTIVSPKDSLNTDGIDPESCRRVRIANCYISTGDDCIILNSGYKYVEGKTLVPTQDVTITNCVFGFGQCGVGIGSETAGGRSIKGAINFLMPYAISGKKWDYQQIGGFRASDLEHSLESAALAYHDPKNAAAAKQIRQGDDLSTVILAAN